MRYFTLWTSRHPVWGFLVLTFIWTWFWWGIAVMLGVGEGPSPLLMIGGLGPAIAAWILSHEQKQSADDSQRRLHRRTFVGATLVAASVLAVNVLGNGKLTPDGQINGLEGIFLLLAILLVAGILSAGKSPNAGIRKQMATLLHWRQPLWSWATAVFIYPAILLMGAGLAWSLGAGISAPEPVTRPLTEWVPVFVMGVLMTGLFRGGLEEPGWRGLMLPELQRRFSPLTASIVIAVPWALWHLPLHISGFYSGPVVEGMVLRIIRMTPLSILFTWLYNRSGGSLLLMVVLHAVHNNSSIIAPASYWSFVPGVLLIGVFVVWDRMWQPLDRIEVEHPGKGELTARE